MTLVVPCQSRGKACKVRTLLLSDLLSSFCCDKAALCSISRKELSYLGKLAVWSAEQHLAVLMEKKLIHCGRLGWVCPSPYFSTAEMQMFWGCFVGAGGLVQCFWEWQANLYFVEWKWSGSVSYSLWKKEYFHNQVFVSILVNQSFCSELLLTWQLSMKSSIEHVEMTQGRYLSI